MDCIVAYSGLFNGGLREELKKAAMRPGEKALSLPEVTGSADSLVKRVSKEIKRFTEYLVSQILIYVSFFQILIQEGLGKYSQDPEFVRYTSQEMQEALEMTREEMDRAAHRLLMQEKMGSTNLGFNRNPDGGNLNANNPRAAGTGRGASNLSLSPNRLVENGGRGRTGASGNNVGAEDSDAEFSNHDSDQEIQ